MAKLRARKASSKERQREPPLAYMTFLIMLHERDESRAEILDGRKRRSKGAKSGSVDACVHQLVKLENLLHEEILDVLDPHATDAAGDLVGVRVHARGFGEEFLESYSSSSP